MTRTDAEQGRSVLPGAERRATEYRESYPGRPRGREPVPLV